MGDENGTVVLEDGEYKIKTDDGWLTMGNVVIGGSNSASVSAVTGVAAQPYTGIDAVNSITITAPKAQVDYILDTYEMNQVVVEHKVQEQELIKLKEVDPAFADHIKANLTKSAAEKIVQKMSFTKTKDKDLDVHSFRGRVWVFTKAELEQLIKDAQNA